MNLGRDYYKKRNKEFEERLKPVLIFDSSDRHTLVYRKKAIEQLSRLDLNLLMIAFSESSRSAYSRKTLLAKRAYREARRKEKQERQG